MTILTLTSSDPRHQRAVLLVADSGQWLRPERLIAGRRAVGIPSQRVRGLYHWTDGHTCSCGDYVRRQQACKHVIAHRLDRIARGASRGASQPASDVIDGLRAMLQCRCSASGSQGACQFATTDAAEMTEHYRIVHCWPSSRTMPHMAAQRYADVFERFED